MKYFIYSKNAEDFLRPGTAILYFGNEADANAHLRRLPQENVAAPMYEVVQVKNA
jgi:hypothetical protein